MASIKSGLSSWRNNAYYFFLMMLGVCLLAINQVQLAYGQSQEVLDGIDWLVANQLESGHWESSNETEFRDVSVVVGALQYSAPDSPALQYAMPYVKRASANSTDYLSRQITLLAQNGDDTDYLVAQLLDLQNPVTSNLVNPNYPEGGWGAEKSFASNAIDTALSLKALKAAGVDGGFVVTDRTIAAGGTDTFSIHIPEDAGDIELIVKNLTGVIAVRIGSDEPPTLYDRSYHVPYAPVKLDENQLVPGKNFLRIDSREGATYTIEVSYESDGLKTNMIADAVHYLTDIQNSDGGWGVQRSVDSDVYVTSEVILALKEYTASHGLDAIIDSAASWLLEQQNSDGGYGDEESSVYETAFALQALLCGDYAANPAYSQAVGFIVSHQASNGSWDDSPLYTAVAINALHTAHLRERILNVSPTKIEASGSAGTAAITIANTGSGDLNWAATPQNSWITIEGESQGVNDGTLTVNIEANPGDTPRIGLVTVMAEGASLSPQTIEITQGRFVPTQANLAIDYRDIQFTPEPALETGAVEISATVANNGYSPIGDIEVAFYKGVPADGGQLIGLQTIDTMDVGQRTKVSVVWSPIDMAGEELIYISANSRNNTEEIDLKDNSAFRILPILSLPDLAVSTNSIQLNPALPKAGESVYLRVTVLNAGGTTVNNVPVSFLVNGHIIGNSVIPQIEGYENATAAVTYIAGSGGAYQFEVAVDPENQLIESNESNNTALRTINVQENTLSLTERFLSPNGDEQQDTTQLSFTMQTPEDIRIRIVNRDDEIVRNYFGDQFNNTTSVDIEWDGRDDMGRLVPDGVYMIQLFDADGQMLVEMPVTIDTNRSPLIEAIGTQYLRKSNLTCMLPDVSLRKWLPDESGLVMYVSYPDADAPGFPTGLYSVAPDGGDLKRITPWEWCRNCNADIDYYYGGYSSGSNQFVLSADGEHVAFILDEYHRAIGRSTKSQLWIVERDGRNLTMLDEMDLEQAFTPIRRVFFSPDNMNLAYKVDTNGVDELWLVQSDGNLKRKIYSEDTDTLRNFDEVWWSADGSRFLLAPYDWTQSYSRIAQLRLFDISGQTQNLLDIEASVEAIEWLTNDIVLSWVYDPNSGDNSNHLWLIDLRDPDAYKDMGPCDSYSINSDRTQFVFARRSDDQAELFLADIAGNSQLLHASTAFDYAPTISDLRWSPNNRKIAFIDSGCIGSGGYGGYGGYGGSEGYLNVYSLDDGTAQSFMVTDDEYGCMMGESFHISTPSSGGDWQERAELHFGTHYDTQSVNLSRWFTPPDGSYRIRISQTGKDAAHADQVALMIDGRTIAPTEAMIIETGEDVVDKLALRDNDVADMHEKTVELAWPDIPISGRAVLVLNGREEDLSLREAYPFRYPDSGSFHFTLENSGAVVVDGQITDQDQLGLPLFKVYSNPVTGHPSGYTYGFVKSDGQHLYVVLDFTPDNTLDDGRDWAQIELTTQSGKHVFRIDGSTADAGKTSLTYTGAVPWEHKVYEFAIPIEDIGAALGDPIAMAVSAYGTAGASGEDGPPLRYRGDLQWLGDSNTLMAADTLGVFALNLKDGQRIDIPIEKSQEWLQLDQSPLDRYIGYNQSADPESVCYGLGYTDRWAMSSLLNLTADLRVVRKKSSVVLKGVAADLNFAGYSLEYADINSPDDWRLIMPPSDIPVIDDTFTEWVPPYEGTFLVKLTVSDTAGNSIWDRKRLSWGKGSAVVDISMSDKYFSPNGDDIKDEVILSYRVMLPVHLEIQIADSDGQLVRAYTRNYASIPQGGIEEQIAWDGRDNAGLLLPDGAYVLNVFDFAFPIELDTVFPDCHIQFLPIRESEEGEDEPPRLLMADLWGHAVDLNMKYWRIEKGTGDTPQDWIESWAGTRSFTGWQYDSELEQEVRSMIEIYPQSEFDTIVGKKFRIVSEDYAGNKTVFVGDYLEQKHFWRSWQAVYYQYWIPTIFPPLCSNRVPRGENTLFSIETVRLPVISSNIEYQLHGADEWHDLPPTPDPGALFLNSVWNSSDFDLTAVKNMRVRITDAEGSNFYSNELPLVVCGGGSCCGGGSGPFLVLVGEPEEGPCDSLSPGVTISAINPELGPKAKNSNPGWEPTDFLAEQGFDHVCYYLDISPAERLELHCEPFELHDHVSYYINTSAMAEGRYPATIQFQRSSDERIYPVGGHILVDHQLPAPDILSPMAGENVCPHPVIEFEQSWSTVGINIAAAENNPPARFELYYGQGAQPTEWHSVMWPVWDLILKRPVLRPVKGWLENQVPFNANWAVGGLAEGVYTIQHKSIDAAGNTACTTTTFYLETGIRSVTVDLMGQRISANGDGLYDAVEMAYSMDNNALVDIRVYRVNEETGDRTFAATIDHDRPYADGVVTYQWDGDDGQGGTVPDGFYALSVAATDSCGYVHEKFTDTIEVDNTPPTTRIDWPRPDDTLGTIVSVLGTASDRHFFRYELTAASIEDDSLMLAVAVGKTEVPGGPLGEWNTFDLSGEWEIVLKAYDTFGNQNETSTIVDFGVRQLFIEGLEALPPIFSPNGDSRKDTSRVQYEVSNACRVTLEVKDAADAVRRRIEINQVPGGLQFFTFDGKDDAGQVLEDGTYRLFLTAALLSDPNINQQEFITLQIDNTAPTVTMVQPTDKSYWRAPVMVRGSIDDATLIQYSVSYADKNGATVLDEGQQSRQNHLFDLVDNLEDGEYVLRVDAEDGAGNRTTFSSIFNVDRTPPVVTLTSPERNLVFGGQTDGVEAGGTIVEENPDTWELRYGPGDSPSVWTVLAQGTELPGENDLFNWPVGAGAGVADGRYTLSLYIKDLAGWERESSVPVDVDNTPPVLEISAPADGSYITARTDISGTFDDNYPAGYTVELASGDCGSAYQFTSILDGADTVSDGLLAPFNALPVDGPYCLRLKAEDKAGNRAETSVGIIVDTQPPGPPLLTGSVENGTDTILEWTANTEPDLAGYTLYRNNQKVNTELLNDTGFTDQGLAEGSYTYTVRAVDHAGWESEPSGPVTLRIDTTGPTAKLRSPVDGARVSDVVDVKGTAYSDDDFARYRILIGQGETPTAWTPLIDSPVAIAFGQLVQWDTLGFAEGTYVIKLEAEDINGNLTEDQVQVVVDNTPPEAPVLESAIATGGDVVLTWQANGEDDLAGYLVYRNGRLANVSGTVIGDLAPYLVAGNTYDDMGLPDGTFEYYLIAMDTAGNYSAASQIRSVTIDTHPPAALIITPGTGHRFENTLWVLADSADLDIAAVQFQYGATGTGTWTDLGAAVTAAPFGIYFNPMDLGLSYGSYQLRAVATDQNAQTDAAPAAIEVIYADMTAPQAVAGVAVAVTGGQIDLSWEANTEDDLAGYNVYRVTDTGTTKVNTAPITDNSFTYIATEDGEYQIHVTAVDDSGNESPASPIVTAVVYTPTLNQPYTPVASTDITITGGQVHPDDQIAVFVDTGSGPQPAATATADADGLFSFEVTLTGGQNSITVYAADGSGNQSRTSQPVVVVSNTPPSTPTGLNASVDGHNVTLSWDANPEADLAGYNLYRDGQRINADQPVAGGTASASYASYYAYRAFDGNPGTYWYAYLYSSTDTQWWQITLPTRELIQRIELEWYSDAYIGKAYQIQAWSGFGWVTVAAATDNDQRIRSHTLETAYGADRLRIVVSDGVAEQYNKQLRLADVRVYNAGLITDITRSDADLDDGTYQYQVSAVDDYGFESPLCDEVAALVGDTTAPAAPQALAATENGSGVDLDWADNSESDLAGYYVYRNSDQGWTRLNEAPLTQSAFRDENLVNGTYAYYVTAVDLVQNESDPSQQASATVLATLPATPVDGTINVVPRGKALEICWTPPAQTVAGYNLYRSTAASGPYEKINETLLVETCFLDEDLVNGTTYYYRIVSVDAVGNESPAGTALFAVPADSVSPLAPVIYQPTVSGVPVTVDQPEITVIGRSEPGAYINLYDNGIIADAVQAIEETQVEQSELAQGAFNALASPDGRHVAYRIWDDASYSYMLIVEELATGSRHTLTPEGADPAWSPDSQQLAFVYPDMDYWYYRIGIFDLRTGLVSDLIDEQFSEELSPTWSADGKRLAFQRYYQGTNDLWVKDFETGDMAIVSPDVGGSTLRIRFSPDGQYLAYTSAGYLYLLRVADTQADMVAAGVIDNYAAYAFGFSPDSSRLAFISEQDGDPDIYIMDLANRTAVPVTQTTEAERALWWSPDGKDILFGETGAEDLVRLVAVDNPDQLSTIHTLAPHTLRTLSWWPAGGILFNDGSDLYRLQVQGTFRVDGLRLTSGEHLLHAVATDAAGNSSPASESISVTLNASAISDLAIGDEDIFVYPAMPVSGETISVSLPVRNVGSGPAENIEVEIHQVIDYMDTRLIHQQTVEHLAPQSEEWLRFDMDTKGLVGNITLIVLIDRYNRIAEESEINNQAATAFNIVDAFGVNMKASIYGEQFGQNDQVELDITVQNSGPEQDVTLMALIADADDKTVAVIDSVQLQLAYGDQNVYSWNWQTQTNPAGAYKAVVRLTPETGPILQREVPFTIAADFEATSWIAPAKPQYLVDEPVQLNAGISNITANGAIDQMSVVFQVYDSDNQMVFQNQQEIYDLLAGSEVSLSAVWPSENSMPGEYRVVLYGIHQDAMITSGTATFTVAAVTAFDGELTVNPVNVAKGDPVTAEMIFSNYGGVLPDDLEIILRLVDTQSLSTVEEYLIAMNHDVGDNYTEQVQFGTGGCNLGPYRVEMYYRTSNEEKLMTAAYFNVIDSRPPSVSINDPLDGAVLTESFIVLAEAVDRDSAIREVEIRIDDGPWTPMSRTATYSDFYGMGWNPQASDQGGHTLSVQATDTAGNTSDIVSIGITIDMIAPMWELDGSLVAEPTTIDPGGAVLFTYHLGNSGQQDIGNLNAWVDLIAAADGSVVSSTDLSTPLGAGSTVRDSFTLSTNTFDPGAFVAVLYAEAPDSGEIMMLARSVFYINEPSVEMRPPVAVPGGPYVCGVGEDLILDASASFDDNAADGPVPVENPQTGSGFDEIVAYMWDIDGDGLYGSEDTPAEPEGVSVVVNFGDFTGNRNVGLKVVDSFGQSGPQSAAVAEVAVVDVQVAGYELTFQQYNRLTRMWTVAWRVSLVNQSDVPIYDVTARWSPTTIPTGVLATDDNVAWSQAIAPGQTVMSEDEFRYTYSRNISGPDLTVITWDVSFTDAAGQQHTITFVSQ